MYSILRNVLIEHVEHLVLDVLVVVLVAGLDVVSEVGGNLARVVLHPELPNARDTQQLVLVEDVVVVLLRWLLHSLQRAPIHVVPLIPRVHLRYKH